MFNTLEVLYSDWFIYNVVEHLVPKDLYSLKFVSKYYYKNIDEKTITNSIIINIHKRLKQVLDKKYDTFIKFIEKKSIVISGSFIMQCILCEYYENSDIDLYSYLSHDSDKFFDIINMEDLDEDQEKNFKDYGALPYIHDIINAHLKNGHKLQNIRLYNMKNYDDVKNYVINKYDMDMCKNIFTIVDNKSVLYTHNLNRVMNKWEHITEFDIESRKKRRIEKYILRGFNFKCDSNTFDKLDHICYAGKFYPFLVYRKNTYGGNMALLGMVIDKMSLFLQHNFYNSMVLLCNDINKYKNGDVPKPYVADMSNVVAAFRGGVVNDNYKNITKNITPNFPCRIEKWEIHTGPGREIRKQHLIMINYDDLDNDRQVKYKQLFDTKNSDGFLQCEYLNKIY
jgi:hypothetical protein